MFDKKKQKLSKRKIEAALTLLSLMCAEEAMASSTSLDKENSRKAASKAAVKSSASSSRDMLHKESPLTEGVNVRKEVKPPVVYDVKTQAKKL